MAVAGPPQIGLSRLTVNAIPFAAFMLFLVDLLVIYGLVVYGGWRTHSSRPLTW